MQRTPKWVVSVGVGTAAKLLAITALLTAAICGAKGAHAATIYVRLAGDDGNDGLSPGRAVRTITHGAAVAGPDDRIVVGPGTYNEGNITPTAFARVSFVADRRGREVGDPPGDVVVDATNLAAGFVTDHNLGITIDGFVVYGAVNGIYVKSDSDHAIVSNNIVSNNNNVGVYVQDSKNVTVFNNLIYNNQRTGILVTGSAGGSSAAQVINNTVYHNGNRGIFFAGAGVASPNGLVINNIAQGNAVAGIQIDEISTGGYLSAGNVADRYASGTPVDATDIRADPLFIDPAGPDGVLGGAGYRDDDFHLSQVAAGQAGTSPAVDMGSHLARQLKLERASTRTDGRADSRLVDAGYHYGNFGRVPLRARAGLRYALLYVNSVNGSDTNDGATQATALQSLAHALQFAQPGNLVLLLGGSYHPDPATGELLLANSGKPGREIVILGTNGAVIDGTGFQRGMLIVGRTNLRLVGLDVTGASDTGIEIRSLGEAPGSSPNALDITLLNCRLHDNGRRGLHTVGVSQIDVRADLIDHNGFTGIQVEGGQVDIIRSTLKANVEVGVSAITGATVSVSSTELLENGTNGMLVDTSAATLTNVTLRANVQDGLRQMGGTVQVLESTAVQNKGNGAAVTGADQFILRNSRMYNNGQYGVQIASSQMASVSGSVVYSNRGNGIAILDSPSALLQNNVVYANGSSGILIAGDMAGSPSAQVLNNTLFGNGNRGLLIGGSNDQPPSPGAVVLRNIFQGNGVAGLQVNELSLPGYSGDYNLSVDPYGAITPIGLHDVLADPLLIQPAGADGILGGDGAQDDDFHLSQRTAGQRVTSPAVDAGGIGVTDAGLQGTTTRSDGVADKGPVDLGYHYSPESAQ